MKIVFRADASTIIGAGHLSRCLTLAESLKTRGAHLTFVCAAGSSHFVPRITEVADRLIELPHVAAEVSDPSTPTWLTVSEAEDARSTLASLDGEFFDWVVVDHYGLGETWETHLREITKHLLVIDDLANRAHDCDVLLDQNLRPDGADAYRDLVPIGATVLQGPRYALLRDEFTQRRHHHVRTDVRRILVSFGGVDGSNGTSTALAALADLDVSITVDVVIGAQHPARESITDTCLKQGHTCHVQTTAIADLMDAADLAIGAGGASSWERCIVGLPAIVLVMAENQMIIAEELTTHGAVVNLGDCRSVRADDLVSAVDRLRSSDAELSAMSAAAYAVMANHVDVAEVIGTYV